MTLLERVTTLLRANVNDVLDKAEDPAVMLKQLLRDMDNQLLQVKTQVAMAIADEHLLESKRTEHEELVASWRRKAELALARNNEELARAAVGSSVQEERLLAGYTQKLAEQRVESETLRRRYRELEAKRVATASEGELLLTSYHRDARQSGSDTHDAAKKVLGRMREEALLARAARIAEQQVALELAVPIEDRFAQMEQDEKVEMLLAELKRQPNLLDG